MAKFSATIFIVAVAVLAVSEVLGQSPVTSCGSRSDCDASLCQPGTSVCCDGYAAALGGKIVYAFKSGKCTCCAKGCVAELAHGDSVTNNTESSADAYHQGCKK